MNNGASSGVLKTTNGGSNWVSASNGLLDPRIGGLWLHPDDPTGKHVLCGTPTGMYESINGGDHWTFVNETKDFGGVWNFKQGTMYDKLYLLVATGKGIATLPAKGGSTWTLINSPIGGFGGYNKPMSLYFSMSQVIAYSCTGGVVGKAVFSSPTKATFTKLAMRCNVAAVHPRDPNYLIASMPGNYTVYISRDGGKTSKNINNNGGVAWYVLFDNENNMYCAGEPGVWQSQDNGTTWNVFHVQMDPVKGKHVDRWPHDYQRLVPDFAGDGLAFPSDQGLFIKPKTQSMNLTKVNGDMSNCITLGVAVTAGDSSNKRNLVTTMWDWGPLASFDSGKSWGVGSDYWTVQPAGLGEGGGSMHLGRSQHIIMWHRTTLWFSSDGGHKMNRVNIGSEISSSIQYFSKNRIEPTGTVLTIINKQARNEIDDSTATAGTLTLIISEDFGQTWPTEKPLPSILVSAIDIVVDPTTNDLYAISSKCLSKSKDKGTTWQPCSTAKGLSGNFHQLLIKNSKVMILLRSGAVPLRTMDSGNTWIELTNCQPLYKGGNVQGSYSWSGNTVVLIQTDSGAPSRGERGSYVWKSSNDGADWTDETGDIVTMALHNPTWYESDLYIPTSGEGILLANDFDK